MKTIRAALVLSLALLTAACLPVTTKNPIGSTAGVKPDPALYGVWRGRDSDGDTPGYFHFLFNEDGTMTALVVTPPHGPDGGSWSYFTLQTTTLGANHFINARDVTDNGKPADPELSGAVLPLLYRFDRHGRLTLYLMDESAAKDAIKAGKLKGAVDPGQSGDVSITSDAAELDAFMKTKDGAALFDKPMMVLRKVE